MEMAGACASAPEEAPLASASEQSVDTVTVAAPSPSSLVERATVERATDHTVRIASWSVDDSIAGVKAGRARVLSKGEAKGTPDGYTDYEQKKGTLPNSEPGDTSYAFVRGLPLDADDQILDHALQQLREHEDCLPPAMRLGTAPRPVYELALGTISVQFKLQVKEGRRAQALSRLNGHTFDEIERGMYWSRQQARAAAREKLANAFPSSKATHDGSASKEIADGDDDDDWEVVETAIGHLRSELIQALCRFVRHAEAMGAVLYIPWYIAEPYNAGAFFFDKVLQLTNGYRGPIVVSVPDVGVAVEAGEVGEPLGASTTLEYLPGEQSTFFKWPVMRNATHLVTFVVAADQQLHTASIFPIDQRVIKRLAGDTGDSRLVPSLIERGPELTTDGRAGGQPKALVAINGGKGVLWHCAAAAQAGIPLLLLEGTGRLCDALPRVWLRRFDKAFDPQAASVEILARCGFHNVAEEYGMLLLSVLRARLITHALKSGAEVLHRLLLHEFHKRERAFDDARALCLAYHIAADKYERPARLLNAVYLIGGLVITVLSVVKSAHIDPAAALAAATAALAAANGSEASSATLARADMGSPRGALTFVLAVLPVLLAVVVSLRKDLNHTAKAVGFRYGAALIEKHLWQYCTRTGNYSNLSLAAADDVPTARATALLDEMGRIQQSVIHKDTTVRSRSGRSQVGPADEAADGSPGGDAVGVPLTVRWTASRHKWRLPTGPIETAVGDAYVDRRLQRRLEHQQALEARWQRQLIFLKTFTYLVGAVGSILALMGLDAYVAVTTAVTTVAAAWDSAAPLEDQLRRSRACSRLLSSVVLQWQAKPAEVRIVQQTCDVLVEQVESAIVDLTPPPLAADSDGGGAAAASDTPRPGLRQSEYPR